MPSKKTAKTSKTAHVLNLLTDPAEAAPPAPAPAPAPYPHTPTVLEIEKVNDEAVAERIRAALEREAEAGLDPPPPETDAGTSRAPAETADVPAESAPPETGEPPAAEPAPEAPSGGEAPEDAPAAGGEPTAADTSDKPLPPSFSRHVITGDITYVNVMQALVEEKAGKYIKMFGLCPCLRCRVDVIALALTKLPSKYVVMRENEMIPMLSVYEGRYSAAITTQVIWACKQVMDSPRH